MNAKSGWWKVLLGAVFVLVTFMGTLFIVTMVVGKLQRAPIELVRLDYSPPPAVCPGDVLPFALEWYVRRPVTMELTPTHNRGHDGSGGHVQTARAENIVGLNVPVAGTITDDDLSLVIPDLPPGEYARIISIGTKFEASPPVFVTLPYTIDADCE